MFSKRLIKKLFASLPALLLCAASVPAAFGQTFANIPSLAFTGVVGGANPLPQILMVTSTGTNMNFSVTPSTSSGGSWLTASPTGTGCCATPEAVTVSVNTTSLATGTYNGQIVIAQYFNGTPTMTVPVTLTVAAANSAFFGNMAGQASFSMTPGGAPPNQTIQIENAGSGTLNWTATITTADGGNWLDVPVKAGSAPSLAAIGISPSSLPGGGSTAGTYVGQIAFKTTGSSVTVPVSVTVGASVFTQINPIYMTMPLGGGNPLPHVINLTSTGTTNYLVSSAVYTGTGGKWLSVSNLGGECCATPEAITVSANGTGLAAGTYIGEIVFTQYFQNVLAVTVPVVLTVEPASATFFDSVPGGLSFFRTTTETPAAQVIPIRNAGTGALNWTASDTTADGGTG